jgi:hypothetical protein
VCAARCRLQASLWLVASDVYLRDDQNSAAQTASKAAIKGASMGDVTASGTVFDVRSRGSCASPMSVDYFRTHGDVVVAVAAVAQRRWRSWPSHPTTSRLCCGRWV